MDYKLKSSEPLSPRILTYTSYHSAHSLIRHPKVIATLLAMVILDLTMVISVLVMVISVLVMVISVLVMVIRI